MLLHQRFIPGLAIASYLVGDEKTGEASTILSLLCGIDSTDKEKIHERRPVGRGRGGRGS
jgi:hypothetical protein